MDELERKQESQRIARMLREKMQELGDDVADVAAKSGTSTWPIKNLLHDEKWFRLTLGQKLKIEDYLER